MYDRARFDDLDLDARSHWVGNSKTISVELFRQLSKQQALKRVTTLGHIFFMTVTLQTFKWHDQLVCFIAILKRKLHTILLIFTSHLTFQGIVPRKVSIDPTFSSECF